MSHTPGPWKVVPNIQHIVDPDGPEEPWIAQSFDIVGDSEFRVARTEYWSIGADVARAGYLRASIPALARANAVLIAAAPLLLDAAEAALRLFEEYAIEDEHPQKIAALRDAIKAARGNQ